MNRLVNIHGGAKSGGIALIFALLLLLILTVIGVGTLSSVSMQERMASNANLQALAFQAASAGVTETLEQWLDVDNWPVGATCDRGSNQNWRTNWTAPIPLVVPGIPAGFAVQYETQLGCFEADNWELLTGSTFAPPQQLLALSRGRVFRAANGLLVGNPIAEREVEVRLERRGGDLPECLIQMCELDIPPAKNLKMPNAKAFGIDAGEGGCPMGADIPEDAVAMRNQLRANQVGQYRPTDPGITFNPLRGAWGDPVQLARAVNGIKIGVRAYEAWEPPAPPAALFRNAIYPGGADAAAYLGYAAGSNPFQACAGELIPGNSTDCPAPATNLTYVAGDLDVAGNCMTQGMVIVEGALLSSGTPAYAGNLLLLGGRIAINGFGQAPNSGLLILQHLVSANPTNSARTAYEPVEDMELGKCIFDVDGGGTATIRPLACAALQGEWVQLNECLRDLAIMTDPGVLVEWDDPNDPASPPARIQTDIFEHLKAAAGPALADLDRPDLREPDPDNPLLTVWAIEFPVPACAGATSGRQNVIASWREFIDRGRWDAVPILN